MVEWGGWWFRKFAPLKFFVRPTFSPNFQISCAWHKKFNSTDLLFSRLVTNLYHAYSRKITQMVFSSVFSVLTSNPLSNPIWFSFRTKLPRMVISFKKKLRPLFSAIHLKKLCTKNKTTQVMLLQNHAFVNCYSSDCWEICFITI